MLEKLLELIKKLFGIKETTTNTEQQRNNETYDDEYKNTKQKINITAIVSNKIATLTLSDSTAMIEEKNRRCILLNNALSDVWNKAKKITAAALGTGGCLIIPYIKDGRILFDIVKQSRLLLNEKNGDKITRAAVIADKIVVNDKVYYRIVNYAVEGTTLYITYKTVSEHGDVVTLPQWEGISDIAISNVDRALFGYVKSPIDNRKNSDDFGVPITYGCKELEKDILECLAQAKKEFDDKRVRLQVDERTLEKNPKTGKPILKEDDLFIGGHSDDGDLFNVFDPAIRETSYHARLDKLCELLEKQIGTSRGILTAPATHSATATEIKTANGDTFAIVSDIRKALEKGLEDFLYACDVLANYYNLTPPGEYEVKFDWSYSMIESTTEEWAQMKDLQGMGAMSKAELRAWKTGEDIEDAQKAIDEIKKNEPPLSTLIGMSE